jgi:hypothetical protein
MKILDTILNLFWATLLTFCAFPESLYKERRIDIIIISIIIWLILSKLDEISDKLNK